MKTERILTAALEVAETIAHVLPRAGQPVGVSDILPEEHRARFLLCGLDGHLPYIRLGCQLDERERSSLFEPEVLANTVLTIDAAQYSSVAGVYAPFSDGDRMNSALRVVSDLGWQYRFVWVTDVKCLVIYEPEETESGELTTEQRAQAERICLTNDVNQLRTDIAVKSAQISEELSELRYRSQVLANRVSEGIRPPGGTMHVRLHSGREVQVQVNQETGMLVVDVAIQNEDGDLSGNECVRLNLNKVDLPEIETAFHKEDR